ncbi:MAG TPA: beta-galactosidase [Clostridiales bacterium]|nr:beta-galactosidase [Clostridiales bacterium]
MGKLRFRQVHLDFHTSEQIRGIGDKFDPEEFAQTLKEACVDSITCFARCHHGMIFYDTDFPGRHPYLNRNLLKEQIDACRKVGIKVPIYITVGLDEYIAKRHPEWLERRPDGGPGGAGPLEAGWRKLCFNTPYIDYVEKQTIDLLKAFDCDVDGLFFDIISQNPCCCNYCLDGMTEAGLDPASLKDRTEFARQVLNKFKKRMTETVRKYDKDCTIFYNSGHVGPGIRETLDTYSHLELESLPSGGWGYEHFPITARYARNLGKEYLAMTGKFHKSWADFGGFKNQAALEYECFTGLALGAKCSIGDQLHPSGEINKATYQLIGSVFSQVEKKEPWCDDVEGIAEIGVINPEILPGVRQLHPAIKGVYRMLSEAHYQFDVLDDQMDFDRYKVIILPDIITLDAGLKEKLEKYISSGGKVILSYKSGMDASESGFVLKETGVTYVSEAEYSPDYCVAGEKVGEGLLDTEYVMYERGHWVEPRPGTEKLASIYNPYFNRSYKHFCSHNQTPVEKDSGYPAITKADNVIYFSHPIFGMYSTHGMRAYKQLFLNALKLLLPEKLVETSAPTTAQIYLNRQPADSRYVLHILHYIPERRSEIVDTIEDVIPIYDISLKVRLPEKPVSVTLQPSGRKLEFSCEKGQVSFTVPKVHGHEMAVIDYDR